MDMYFFMFLHMKDMENYQTERLINNLLEAGYKFPISKKINRTLFCGNHQAKVSLDGNLHGELEDRDGIQNVV